MNYAALTEKWNLPARLGFVGDGWADLLDEAFTKLVAVGVAVPAEITCIKEKLAGLRLYLIPTQEGRREVAEVLQAVYEAAGRTCETCGAPGLPRSGRWLKTLCENHGQGRLPHHWPTREEAEAMCHEAPCEGCAKKEE